MQTAIGVVPSHNFTTTLLAEAAELLTTLTVPLAYHIPDDPWVTEGPSAKVDVELIITLAVVELVKNESRLVVVEVDIPASLGVTGLNQPSSRRKLCAAIVTNESHS